MFVPGYEHGTPVSDGLPAEGRGELFPYYKGRNRLRAVVGVLSGDFSAVAWDVGKTRYFRYVCGLSPVRQARPGFALPALPDLR